MFDVKELNKQIQAIGLNNIAWIAEDPQMTDDWECYGDPAQDGHLFGFDFDTVSFREDLTRYYKDYKIEESQSFVGMYNIVLLGYGTDYEDKEVG